MDSRSRKRKHSSSDKASTSDKPHDHRRTKDTTLSRAGGAYLPPAKLKLLQQQISDKSRLIYFAIAYICIYK